MKFRSLERVIKEVAGRVTPTGKYLSLQHSVRQILEKKGHYVETDPNDQVVVGTYKTKSFEQSDDAQKLYSNLPKDTPPDTAEKSAILHDKLFDLHKSVLASGRATKENMDTADQLVGQIKKLAADMKLSKEHGYLDRVVNDFSSHLDDSGNTMNSKSLDVEKINDRFASPSKEQTKERQDGDIDNSKFLITRNIKAQRKIKIIDAD